MLLLKSLERKQKAWNDGVVHATLDPDGPGVARLHLIPPKPSLLRNPPSLLVINGTWFLPVGPSWADILRVFFDELNTCCRDKCELTPQEIEGIEQAVVRKMQRLYPRVRAEMILDDLKEIVTLAVHIATGKQLPEETMKGFNLEQYSRFMTAPHRMDLIIAPMSINNKRVCPLSCACCYADDNELMDIDSILSTEEWKTIIDRCREAGIPMLTFTGGEPLTRPDIVDLVQHASWFVTRLNTNGYHLTLELAEALKKASLDGIQITLYSHDQKIHDALVGKDGAWVRTVAGIKNALNAGLSVSINTPLVEKNKDFGKTLRFAHDLGIHCAGCSSLIPTGGAKEQISTGKTLSADDLKNILKDAVALCKELGMELSFTSPGWLDTKEILDIGLPSAPVCGACLSNMAIAPNGQVVPCQSWLKGLTLGDMRTSHWKDIWNHKSSRLIRIHSAAKPKCALKEDF